MGKALIIGAGGVAGVVIHKCCQNSEVFTEICIASRTKSKCDRFREELQDKTSTKITTAQVDANDVEQLIALIEQEKPDIVILDEPINALDESGALKVREILWKLRDNGSIIILACHDAEELNLLSDEIYHIAEGKITGHEVAEHNENTENQKKSEPQ